MSFESQIKEALKDGVDHIKESDFYKDIMNGENVIEYYKEYLRCAYHYVSLSSSFTPLAARRMDVKYLKIRKWILEHSSEEMGHELMALNDLTKLGFSKEDVINSTPGAGVMSWVSYFHYKMAIDNPFCVFGVLYFLEGMATDLAPKLVSKIIESLDDNQKKAITFFREHGDLDHDHLKEQEDLLFKFEIDKQDQDKIIHTIKESARIKRFMLDQVTKVARS